LAQPSTEKRIVISKTPHPACPSGGMDFEALADTTSRFFKCANEHGVCNFLQTAIIILKAASSYTSYEELG